MVHPHVDLARIGSPRVRAVILMAILAVVRELIISI
jgi:hypothetical protein